MAVFASSEAFPVNTKWSLAMAACRGWMAPPPVIWLKVWMAKGAVPSEAGRQIRVDAQGGSRLDLEPACSPDGPRESARWW